MNFTLAMPVPCGDAVVQWLRSATNARLPWRCCSGRGSTAASETRIPVRAPLLSGQLDVLQCAQEHGCKWAAATCHAAALEALKWAREHGRLWDEGACDLRCPGRTPGGVEVGGSTIAHETRGRVRRPLQRPQQGSLQRQCSRVATGQEAIDGFPPGKRHRRVATRQEAPKSI